MLDRDGLFVDGSCSTPDHGAIHGHGVGIAASADLATGAVVAATVEERYVGLLGSRGNKGRDGDNCGGCGECA